MRKIIKFLLWVIILSLAFYGAFNAYQNLQRYLYPIQYREIVEKYSNEYGLDKFLVFSIIKCESGFDKNATSNIGAKGLMQLTDATYEWVCSKYKDSENDTNNLFDEEKNIRAGCRLLRLLYDDFDDTKTVLCAYHAGRNITYDWLEDENYSSDGKTIDKVPYKDTSSYIDRVVKTIEKYNNIYEGEF